MLSSLIAFLAIVPFAFAAPPAQATYCYEDNLLRAFQHTPTAASKYCTTATGKPTFIPATTYPPARLSSACSCFSRFPSETTTVAAPPCQPTDYTFSGVSHNNLYALNILARVNPAKPCNSGITITYVCGTFQNIPLEGVGGLVIYPTDFCFYPDGGTLSASGITFKEVDTFQHLFSATGGFTIEGDQISTDYFVGNFVPVPCTSPEVCPGPTVN